MVLEYNNGNVTSYLYLQYVPASAETLIIHFKLVFVHESEILSSTLEWLRKEEKSIQK